MSNNFSTIYSFDTLNKLNQFNFIINIIFLIPISLISFKNNVTKLKSLNFYHRLNTRLDIDNLFLELQKKIKKKTLENKRNHLYEKLKEIQIIIIAMTVI